jgi:hypothetical protein
MRAGIQIGTRQALRSFFGTVAPVPRGIGQHSRILHPRMPSPFAVPAADRVTERQETKGI